MLEIKGRVPTPKEIEQWEEEFVIENQLDAIYLASLLAEKIMYKIRQALPDFADAFEWEVTSASIGQASVEIKTRAGMEWLMSTSELTEIFGDTGESDGEYDSVVYE